MNKSDNRRAHERMDEMQKEISSLRSAFAANDAHQENIIKTLNDILEVLKGHDDKFVTHKQFSHVKAIVYAFVSAILLGFMGALSALVFNNK